MSRNKLGICFLHFVCPLHPFPFYFDPEPWLVFDIHNVQRGRHRICSVQLITVYHSPVSVIVHGSHVISITVTQCILGLWWKVETYVVFLLCLKTWSAKLSWNYHCHFFNMKKGSLKSKLSSQKCSIKENPKEIK
jgi:hypothetical protein